VNGATAGKLSWEFPLSEILPRPVGAFIYSDWMAYTKCLSGKVGPHRASIFMTTADATASGRPQEYGRAIFGLRVRTREPARFHSPRIAMIERRYKLAPSWRWLAEEKNHREQDSESTGIPGMDQRSGHAVRRRLIAGRTRWRAAAQG